MLEAAAAAAKTITTDEDVAAVSETEGAASSLGFEPFVVVGSLA